MTRDGHAASSVRAGVFGAGVLGLAFLALLAVAPIAEARLSPTATAVACEPANFVVGESTTCTATVTDQSPLPSTPTGTVVSRSSIGGLETNSCTLTGSGASASCSWIYTPNVTSPTVIELLARYEGDGSHAASEGTAVVRAVLAGGGPPPVPTTKAVCKNGGWRGFAGFKNQGDCVSYVATGGRNTAGGI